jgi:hypothetical protein
MEKATRTSPIHAKRIGPFTEEDMYEEQEPETTPQLDEGSMPSLPSQTLRQLSQGEVNSKSSNRSISPEKGLPSPASAHSVNLGKESSSTNSNNARINDTMAALLAQKKQASHPTSVIPGEEINPLAHRRKGKLGRAISGSLSSNAHDDLSRHNSTDAALFSASDETETKPNQTTPIPSQKVIYEDENAREERAKLIARLGGRVVEGVDNGRVVVKSIGVVKDTMVGDTGGLRRRRGR